MYDRIEHFMGNAAATVVRACRNRPRITVVASAAATVLAVFLSATLITVDPDADNLMSPDLTFRKTNAAIEQAFPKLRDNLIVLVDADTGDDAWAAAQELADLLRQSPDVYMYVYLPGDDPYFEDNGLFYVELDELKEMAERIDEAGPLLGTLAESPELPILLGGFTHVISSADGIDSLGTDGKKILQSVTRAVEAFNAGGSAPVEWEDLLFEDLEVDHLNPQVLFVQPTKDFAELDPVLRAIANLRGLSDQMTPRPGLRVRVTGETAIHAEEMSLVIGEALTAGAISLVLVSALLFYALRSFRLLMATVITLLAGLLWTSGFAAVAVGRLTVLTATFAVLYIGLGVDFGIHFAMGYLEERKRHVPAPKAILATGNRVGSALVFCAMTTAIGFYAFLPTDYVAIAEFGLISGSGMFLSLLSTLTLYPALIGLGMGESPKLEQSLERRFVVPLPTFPLRYPRTVVGVAAVLAAAAIAILPNIRFDLDPLNVRDPRVESVQAIKDLLQDAEIPAWPIEVLAQDPAAAADLVSKLEDLDGIGDIYTIDTFVPDNQAESLVLFEQMRESLESQVELTEDEKGRGETPRKILRYTIEGFGVALDIDAELRFDEDGGPLIAEAEKLRDALQLLNRGLDEDDPPLDLEGLDKSVFNDLQDVVDGIRDALPSRPVTRADLPESISERYLAEDGTARVEILSSEDLHQRGNLEAFSDRVVAVEPLAGGAAVGAVEHGRIVVRAFRQAMVTAAVAIFILLLALWRSFKYTAITMAPLIIGASCTAAITVIADLPFNFANIIVIPLILGIGVDSGIHLVHRHRAGLDDAEDLLHTGTARAVVFSALTTVTSFATLGLSNHLGISSLAQLLVSGLLLMLASNLIVLPAILAWLDSK